MIPAGYKQNQLGHLVPVAQIKEQDLLRDNVITDLANKAIKLNQDLAAFKSFAYQELATLVAISAEKHGVSIGGEKGNLSLTSYDGQYKVVRSIANVITFNEELLAAKAIIEKCIQGWSDGADSRLVALVMRAFKPNSNGELRTSAVLDLLKFDMKDKDGAVDSEWARAMEALKDSIQTGGTTTYINLYERQGQSEKYRHIPLDLAAV